MDWTKLPPQLAYLAQPAEQYGAIQFELRIFDFLDSEMTKAQKEELVRLKSAYERDQKLIDEWLNRFRMTEHPEAARVYFLGHLLALANENGYLRR